MKIYLQQDGGRTGPFDESTIREGLNQGTLTPEVYAWSEGMSDWRPLGEVLPAAPARATPVAPPLFQATPFPAAPFAAPGPAKSTKTPGWAKLLIGCGGLLAVAIIALAAVIAFALHQDRMNHGGAASGKAGDDWTKFDKEMADMREQSNKDRSDLQTKIERDMADAEHYETTKSNNPDGGTTTTITPKDNALGDKPITKRVDADGKITTTTEDANGDTVVRTEDKNGNVSTVTTPKQK